MRTIGMSDYTVGEDCFDELPTALAEYGATKVAIIGGTSNGCERANTRARASKLGG